MIPPMIKFIIPIYTTQTIRLGIKKELKFTATLQPVAVFRGGGWEIYDLGLQNFTFNFRFLKFSFAFRLFVFPAFVFYLFGVVFRLQLR